LPKHNITDFNGIIMYRKDYQERDLLVKILTREFGKKMFFVRGAKKRGFKLTADILPFTYGKYIGDIKSEGLSYINSSKSTEQFKNISNDIFKNAYVTYIMSLIDFAFPDSEVLTSWYEPFFTGMKLVDQGLDAAVIANIFEVQLLPVFGVQPELRGCVICGQTNPPLDYSESYGGLLCEKHYHLDPRRMHLDQRTVYYLRQFSVLDLKSLHSINVKSETKKHLRHFLDQIYDDTVGVHPKSKRFIDQMNEWEGPQTSI